MNACNIYAVQQDTQVVLMSEFYSYMFRTSPVHHQERFTSCICRLWYVVIRVLLDTSSRYEVVGRAGLGVCIFAAYISTTIMNKCNVMQSIVAKNANCSVPLTTSH